MKFDRSFVLFSKLFIKIMVSAITIFFICFLGYVIFVVATVEKVDISDFKLDFSSMVYYKDAGSNTVKELEKVYGKENRVWTGLNNMTSDLKSAFIAIEDERFYKHHGVDFKRTFGAVINVFARYSGLKYGGSTITQQLVKNITGDKDATVNRKIQEIVRAFMLERDLTKDQILELYLNTIYLSEGCNGVQAAANVYFNKDVKNLTLAECASIAGITQFPSRYDPFLNPQKNKEKQELVLDKMLDLKMITKEQFDQAKKEKLIFSKNHMNTGENYQSYFVDAVITDVLNDLQTKKGLSKAQASKALYGEGYKIYSTIDPKMQQIVDDYYENRANFPGPKDADQPQSAIVIIDPYTGGVKAIAGGAGRKPGNFTLNRATQTLRQPGSTIKPIGVYAPSIEYGLIMPGSIAVDSYVDYGGWAPRNSYKGFRGAMTIRNAITISCNVIAVKTLETLGVDQSFKFMKDKLNIKSLVDRKVVNGQVYSDKNLSSLALGGLTDGVSVIDMAGAYAAFANKGIYIKPYTYEKVVDANGKIILDNTRITNIAMKEETAAIITDLLKSVVTSGTGTSAALSNMPVAGKTGTTSDDVDRWFVGYTPYYVSAVWYGHDQQRKMNYLPNNPSAKIFKSIMGKIHASLPYKDFAMSKGNVESVSICRISGKLAISTCVDELGKSTAYIDYLTPNKVPTEYCDPSYHIKDAAENKPTDATAPLNDLEKTVDTPVDNTVSSSPSAAPSATPTETPSATPNTTQ